METVSAIIIIIFVIMFCYIVYDTIPSKYTKLEESFGGFIIRSLIRFEYGKSQLRTIVYGGAGTGKTYFVRQYLKLYQDQEQEHDQDQDIRDMLEHLGTCFADDRRSIIIVSKDERDWKNPETGKPYSDCNKCDTNMITSKNMHIFQDSVIFLGDRGDKLNKNIGYYFTEGRHNNVQMIIMCHKPAHTFNTARINSDTFQITSYNGSDLFKNLKVTYESKHDFHGIINDLNVAIIIVQMEKLLYFVVA